MACRRADLPSNTPNVIKLTFLGGVVAVAVPLYKRFRHRV
jgi:hypothetical protein